MWQDVQSQKKHHMLDDLVSLGITEGIYSD